MKFTTLLNDIVDTLLAFYAITSCNSVSQLLEAQQECIYGASLSVKWSQLLKHSYAGFMVSLMLLHVTMHVRKCLS